MNCGFPPFLQPAFEPVTEQRAERLSLSDTVEQPRAKRTRSDERSMASRSFVLWFPAWAR